MKMIALLSIFLFSNLHSSIDLDILYHHSIPALSSNEIRLVSHVKQSFEQAIQMQSKLTEKLFTESVESILWRENILPNFHPLRNLNHICGYHFLNNICELEGASHLHIGLLAGDSFIAALYGNEQKLKLQIGLDWFKECPEEIFYANCKDYIDFDNCLVINSSCFNIDKSIFKHPIDIFFYDADHSLSAHEKAFTYYNDIFADVFVAMVDDWKCPWIRKPTFKAFEKLGYQILYEEVIQHENWQYIAVIKKTSILPK